MCSSAWLKAATLGVLLFVLEGCGASLAQPFDAMKNAPVTAYRLQNYEPPPPAPNAPATAGAFQLPPQIQQWMTAGAAMLPPGLLPPGLIPGSSTAPVAPQQQVARFHDFRILGWQNMTDAKNHDELMDIMGKEANFEVPRENCMFAEFGFSIAQVNQPPADILISLSCNQIRSFGFAWPHGSKTGLSADTTKRIIAVMQKNFGGT